MSRKKHFLLPVFELIRKLANNGYKKPTAIYIGCFILFFVEGTKLARFIGGSVSNGVPILSADNYSFYLFSVFVLLSVVLVFMGIGVMRYIIVGSLFIFFAPLSYNEYSGFGYYLFKLFAVPLLFLNTTKMWYRRARPSPSTSVGLNDPCPCGSEKQFQDCCAVHTLQNM